MAATLAGAPLYLAHGYKEIARFIAPLPIGTGLPIVWMRKCLDGEET